MQHLCPAGYFCSSDLERQADASDASRASCGAECPRGRVRWVFRQWRGRLGFRPWCTLPKLGIRGLVVEVYMFLVVWGVDRQLGRCSFEEME